MITNDDSKKLDRMMIVSERVSKRGKAVFVCCVKEEEIEGK